VKDRLLSLERCPDGMAGECFYQKQKPPSMPADTPTQLSGTRRGPPAAFTASGRSEQ
jgi:bifunctional non-homologous end joining protein LigD